MANNKTGHKNPPQSTRFKPGKSGNPKGRPKKTYTAKEVFLSELQSEVTVTENNKPVKLSKLTILFRRIFNDAIKGDNATAKMVLTLMQYYGDPKNPEEIAENALPQEDSELLNYYLKQSK